MTSNTRAWWCLVPGVKMFAQHGSGWLEKLKMKRVGARITWLGKKKKRSGGAGGGARKPTARVREDMMFAAAMARARTEGEEE